LNRSPHGNKTAREQFGRQGWQRKLGQKGSGREEERKVLEGRKRRRRTNKVYVQRKQRKWESHGV